MVFSFCSILERALFHRLCALCCRDGASGAGHQLHSLKTSRRTMCRFPPRRYHPCWGPRTVLGTVEGALFHWLHALCSLDEANGDRRQLRSLHSLDATRGVVYGLPLASHHAEGHKAEADKFVTTARILAIYPLHCHTIASGTSTLQVSSYAKAESWICFLYDCAWV